MDSLGERRDIACARACYYRTSTSHTRRGERTGARAGDVKHNCCSHWEMWSSREQLTSSTRGATGRGHSGLQRRPKAPKYQTTVWSLTVDHGDGVPSRDSKTPASFGVFEKNMNCVDAA